MNRLHSGMSFPSMSMGSMGGMSHQHSHHGVMGSMSGMAMMSQQQDQYLPHHQHQQHQHQNQPSMNMGGTMNVNGMNLGMLGGGCGGEQLPYQMLPWNNHNHSNMNHVNIGHGPSSCSSSSAHMIPVAQSICTKDGEPRIPYPIDFIPTIHHVICGRGKKSYGHIGNKHFLKVVAIHMDDYAEATNKQEKSDIVQAIVDEMEAKGGFIRLDPQTGCYYQAEEGAGREKTSQALRDGLNHKYKSSKDIKRKNRKQKRLARQAIQKKVQQQDAPGAATTTTEKRPSLAPSAVSEDGSDSDDTSSVDGASNKTDSEDSPCSTKVTITATTKDSSLPKELVVPSPDDAPSAILPPRTVSATSVDMATDAAAAASSGTVTPSPAAEGWAAGVIHLVDGDGTELEPLPLTAEEVQELPDDVIVGPFDDFNL